LQNKGFLWLNQIIVKTKIIGVRELNITKKNIIIALITFFIGLLIFLLVPYQIHLVRGTTIITARDFPKTISYILMLLGIILGIKSIFEKEKSKNNSKVEKACKDDLIRIIKFLSMFAMYIFGIKIIGFFTLTTIFIVFLMIFLKIKKWYMIFLITIGVDLFLYLIFVNVMKVNLPTGLIL
jgi:putative tricarboxylic transport membrane protein